MDQDKIGDVELQPLLEDASKIQGGFGAIAWAVLEMFKRGGMSQLEVAEMQQKMKQYFAKPTNDECNAILKIVETRLMEDKEADSKLWYS